MGHTFSAFTFQLYGIIVLKLDIHYPCPPPVDTGITSLRLVFISHPAESTKLGWVVWAAGCISRRCTRKRSPSQY